MSSQKLPGDYGRRLLPVTIDTTSQHEPGRPWASLPRDDDDLSKGYLDVSYVAFANAINRMAFLIEKAVGRAEDNAPKCIAYIGAPDTRYHIMSMATAKTGNMVLFSSHMHSTAGDISLMDQCQCIALFTSTGMQIDDILDQQPHLQRFVVPELDELLYSDPVPPYPFFKTFEEAAADTFVLFHTSGSTGNPKPIPITHGFVAALDASRRLPDHDDRLGARRARRFSWTHPGPTRLFCPFVPFHSVSGYAVMVSSVFGGATYVPGFKNRLTSPADAPRVLRYADVDSAFVDPGTLEEIAISPDAAELLTRMKLIIYSGGRPPTNAGNMVAKGTYLQQEYGSTETGPSISYVSDCEDWDCMYFDTVHMGIDWRPVPGSENHYEMVLVKTPEAEPYQGIFAQRPDITEWPMHDIWAKHPTKPDMWRFVGRDDDLIAFADGHKLYPTPYEALHSGKPFVKAAVLAGQQHHQPVLLLHVEQDIISNEGEKGLLEAIWPGIEEVNSRAPRNAQIAKTHVVISSGEKGFQWTDKGTVKRKATIAALEDEIAEVYRRFGDEAPDLVTRTLSG